MARRKNVSSSENEPPSSKDERPKKQRKVEHNCSQHEFKDKLLSKFRPQNIVRCFDSFQQGRIRIEQVRRSGENIISEKLMNFNSYLLEEVCFDKRITALQFHPKNPHIIGLGSKGGMLVVRTLGTDYGKGKVEEWEGKGPGGAITGIAFDPFTPDSLFTSSIDGTVTVRSYDTKKTKVLLDTHSYESWYCSVNASRETGLLVAGDTSGVLKVLSKELKVVSEHRLHKKKVNSAEFCKARGWLLATASLDNTVKLWDIRKLNEKSPLNVMQHSCPVNAAYFSQTDGNRLLTTDQYNELRVYHGPLFNLETLIHHPHRQFQHLTPIKATWHPLCDLIVVGRYPDPNCSSYQVGELRTIDIFSAETGERKVQLYSNACNGIVSLNNFNSTGEVLASGMGLFVLYWREKIPFESQHKSKDVRDASNSNSEGTIDLKLPKRTTQGKAGSSKSTKGKKGK